MTEINYTIHWIVIYLVDSAIQRLNNQGLEGSDLSTIWLLTWIVCFTAVLCVITQCCGEERSMTRQKKAVKKTNFWTTAFEQSGILKWRLCCLYNCFEVWTLTQFLIKFWIPPNILIMDFDKIDHQSNRQFQNGPYNYDLDRYNVQVLFSYYDVFFSPLEFQALISLFP